MDPELKCTAGNGSRVKVYCIQNCSLVRCTLTWIIFIRDTDLIDINIIKSDLNYLCLTLFRFVSDECLIRIQILRLMRRKQIITASRVFGSGSSFWNKVGSGSDCKNMVGPGSRFFEGRIRIQVKPTRIRNPDMQVSEIPNHIRISKNCF